jgi:flavin-dependent dehydrogenase
VSDERVGITILTSRRGRFDRHLESFPTLVDRVDGLPHSRDLAAGPLRQKVRSRVAGRVLLVGDAAGYVDALTGEGLGIAFGGAELLIGCVAAGRAAAYDRQWRRMSRLYRMLTAAVLQASATVLIWPKSGSGLEILECRRSLGEDVVGQTDFADSSRHCNGPDQRAEY